jgi:hypothetical protein
MEAKNLDKNMTNLLIDNLNTNIINNAEKDNTENNTNNNSTEAIKCLCKNSIKLKLIEFVCKNNIPFSLTRIVDDFALQIKNDHIGKALSVDDNFLKTYICNLLSELEEKKLM